MMTKSFTKKDLEQLVMDVMHISSITPTIKRQINNFVLVDNMTYKEIARCIVWYDEVFGGKLEPIYGLAFVPAVKERAAAYFRQLELEQRKKAAEAQKLVEFQDKNIIFNIRSLQHQRRKAKQLDLSEINVEGEDNGDN